MMSMSRMYRTLHQRKKVNLLSLQKAEKQEIFFIGNSTTRSSPGRDQPAVAKFWYWHWLSYRCWLSLLTFLNFILKGSIPVIGVIVTLVLRNSSDPIVSINNMDFLLIIPFIPALLITLKVTTTYHLPTSMHGNHDIDKSILFITFFGVVMLTVALILASPLGDNEHVFFGLGLAWIVAAFLQVSTISY